MRIDKLVKKLVIVFFTIFVISILNKTVLAAGVDGTTIVLNPGHGDSWTGCANEEKEQFMIYMPVCKFVLLEIILVVAEAIIICIVPWKKIIGKIKNKNIAIKK